MNTRPFQLVRTTDVTGVSGTGVVATGVEFPDGTVAIRWRGARASTVTWDSLDDALAVHGHGGATTVRWEPPVVFSDAVAATRLFALADELAGFPDSTFQRDAIVSWIRDRASVHADRLEPGTLVDVAGTAPAALAARPAPAASAEQPALYRAHDHGPEGTPGLDCVEHPIGECRLDNDARVRAAYLRGVGLLEEWGALAATPALASLVQRLRDALALEQ